MSADAITAPAALKEKGGRVSARPSPHHKPGGACAGQLPGREIPDKCHREDGEYHYDE